jgi:hypothetical protein
MIRVVAAATLVNWSILLLLVSEFGTEGWAQIP